MNKSRNIFLILAGALSLTLLSGAYSTTFDGAVGNVCEITSENPDGLCYQELPQRGFPLPYVIDSTSTSVIGNLGYEDHFVFLNFTFDIFIYSFVIGLLWIVKYKFIR